jgi:hypothetical protein
MSKKKKYLHEILQEVANCDSPERRSNTLKKYDSLGLRDLLRLEFDDMIKLDLPPGTPPYIELESSYRNPPTFDEKNNLRYLVDHPINKKYKDIEKEGMFIKLIEALHPEDSKIVIAAKDKKLRKNYKGLTKTLIKKTWPNLIKK